MTTREKQMITKKWIRVWIASAVVLLALPALAQDSGSTADERDRRSGARWNAMQRV